MVSTRQMATSGGHNGNSNEELSLLPMRASVVTRQNSNNNNMSAAAASSSSSSLANVSNVVATRQHHNHHHQQQPQSSSCKGNSAPVVNNANISGVPLMEYTSALQLHDLPLEILAKIFSYESYKRIGQLRLVSQRFNEVCMDTLNTTFSKLITQTYNRFQTIKANMPRRESLRRNHPLACECDIIETCHMRLSLLQMTLGKHIERGHCCFFPGAILDELYTILGYIKNTPSLERPYRVTDELFDLSTMAMEYFRDCIEPNLPCIGYFHKDFCRPAVVVSAKLSESSSNSPSPPQSNMVLRKGIRKIKQGMKIYNNQLSVLRNELRTCKRKSTEQGKQMGEQQKLLAEQQKQALEYANRLDENDKKNEEMARKFSTLLQELNKCKTELQYWRSKSPAISACSSCGQKMTTTVLPAEDFQALINQGVKPENIILNLHGDNELHNQINNNATCNDDHHDHVATDAIIDDNHHLGAIKNEFAYPDELTTAKLLNTNKQLKRQHSAITSTTTLTATATNPTSQAKTSIMLLENNVVDSFEPREISMEGIGNNPKNEIINTGLAPNIFYGNTRGVCSASKTITESESLTGSGEYYKGVIVSPLSCSDVHNANESSSLVATLSQDTGVLVMPPETKKARRVQKPTRCLNASNKRSK